MNLRTALPVLALVAGAAGVLPAQSRQARKRPVVPPLTIAARPAVVPPVDSLRLTDVALRSRTVAGAVGKGVDARAKASREPMARPADRWISLVSFMRSRYDSNVNRDLVPTRSVGMVSGLGLRLQAGGDRPWLATEYDAAVHRYSATERFDRVSQRLRISATAQLARALEVGLVSEGSLKGSAEDRDVADQVAVLPRVDLRLSDRHRLRLVGAHRWRRYPDAPEQHARNAYGAVELRQRSADGSTWEGEARVERNAARGDRFDYRRITFATAYSAPLGQRSFLDIELKYRDQRYANRFVAVEDVDVPRHDFRWEPALGWRWSAWGNDLDVRYEPERRGSNDPDKHFVQHLVSVGISRRW